MASLFTNVIARLRLEIVAKDLQNLTRLRNFMTESPFRDSTPYGSLKVSGRTNTEGQLPTKDTDGPTASGFRLRFCPFLQSPSQKRSLFPLKEATGAVLSLS